MCGRFTLTTDLDRLAEHFAFRAAPLSYTPHYNIAPSQPVLTLIDAQEHRAGFLRWGLVPSWAKDPAIGDRMINARAETVATKAAYQRSFTKRRCIIPADGFYEWRRSPPEPGLSRRRTEPTFVHRRDGEPLAFAGLWAGWKVPDELAGTVGDEDGWLRSCAIVTTRANRLL